MYVFGIVGIFFQNKAQKTAENNLADARVAFEGWKFRGYPKDVAEKAAWRLACKEKLSFGPLKPAGHKGQDYDVLIRVAKGQDYVAKVFKTS